MEDTGGVGGWGGCSVATVGCSATANHLPVEESCLDQGITLERRAATRLVSRRATPRLAGGRGWGRGVGQEFLGSPGIENLSPHHNGPRFQGQSELWFCRAGSAQRVGGVDGPWRTPWATMRIRSEAEMEEQIQELKTITRLQGAAAAGVTQGLRGSWVQDLRS